MGFRSLVPERQFLKPPLSCAKSSAASRGFFGEGSAGGHAWQDLWLSLCSQDCPCWTPACGSWRRRLSGEHGRAGSTLGVVGPILPGGPAPLGRAPRPEGGSPALYQHTQGRGMAAGQEGREEGARAWQGS